MISLCQWGIGGNSAKSTQGRGLRETRGGIDGERLYWHKIIFFFDIKVPSCYPKEIWKGELCVKFLQEIKKNRIAVWII